MRRIMAIDPGMTTGIVSARLRDSEIRTGHRGLLSAQEADRLRATEIDGGRIALRYDRDGEPTGWLNKDEVRVAREIWKEIDAFKPDTIVAEDFVLYPNRRHPGNKEHLSPRALWAAIELQLSLSGWVEERGCSVHRQMASEAKTIATDIRLKDWGLWVRGKPHARDAMRHLIVFLRKERVRAAKGDI